jgi:lysozyme
MRLPGFAVFLSACLALAGCTSSRGIEDIVPAPSMETTSAIARPVTPVATVRAVKPKADIAEGQAAEVTEASFPVPAVEPEALLPNPPQPASLAAVMPVPKPSVRDGGDAKSPSFDGSVRQRRFRDAKPINFGRLSPKNYAVHGVDVSRWQGEIDWVKLREQGANFAYIKATDGGDHLDPMFHRNWKGAAEAGLARGAYHFFYWCRTASEQADWFIRNVPKVRGALPPVIDVEWNHLSNCKRRPSRETVLEKMKVFMDRLEAHYGQRPIIYTAPDFYRDNLRGAFPNHPFWLRAVAQHPSKVYPGRDWVFWQYSGSGLSHGVRGRIDLNVFNGTEAQWRAWLRGRQVLAAN